MISQALRSNNIHDHLLHLTSHLLLHCHPAVARSSNAMSWALGQNYKPRYLCWMSDHIWSYKHERTIKSYKFFVVCPFRSRPTCLDGYTGQEDCIHILRKPALYFNKTQDGDRWGQRHDRWRPDHVRLGAPGPTPVSSRLGPVRGLEFRRGDRGFGRLWRFLSALLSAPPRKSTAGNERYIGPRKGAKGPWATQGGPSLHWHLLCFLASCNLHIQFLSRLHESVFSISESRKPKKANGLRLKNREPSQW